MQYGFDVIVKPKSTPIRAQAAVIPEDKCPKCGSENIGSKEVAYGPFEGHDYVCSNCGNTWDKGRTWQNQQATGSRKIAEDAFQCMECGRKVKVRSSSPKCPGCGSYDIDLAPPPERKTSQFARIASAADSVLREQDDSLWAEADIQDTVNDFGTPWPGAKSNCPTCGGEGFVTKAGEPVPVGQTAGGWPTLETCPTCHGVSFTRTSALSQDYPASYDDWDVGFSEALKGELHVGYDASPAYSAGYDAGAKNRLKLQKDPELAYLGFRKTADMIPDNTVCECGHVASDHPELGPVSCTKCNCPIFREYNGGDDSAAHYLKPHQHPQVRSLAGYEPDFNGDDYSEGFNDGRRGSQQEKDSPNYLRGYQEGADFDASGQTTFGSRKTADTSTCTRCGTGIHTVPGGNGPTWVNNDGYTACFGDRLGDFSNLGVHDPGRAGTRGATSRKFADLTYTDSAPPEFIADYDKTNEALKPFAIDFNDGTGDQGLVGAPPDLVRINQELRERGFANHYFASRKISSVRTCRSCGAQVRVQLGNDFAQDHKNGCPEQADFPGRKTAVATTPGYYLTSANGSTISGPYDTPSEALAEVAKNKGSAVEYKSAQEDTDWDTMKPKAFPFGSNTVNGSHKTASLDSMVDFDHVIQVLPDGSVVDAPSNVYAPELWDDELMGSGWSLMDGYSGQAGYSGPVMHNSEFISGGLERDILANPGYYVSLVNYSSDGDEGEGWGVAHKEAPEIKALSSVKPRKVASEVCPLCGGNGKGPDTRHDYGRVCEECGGSGYVPDGTGYEGNDPKHPDYLGNMDDLLDSDLDNIIDGYWGSEEARSQQLAKSRKGPTTVIYDSEDHEDDDYGEGWKEKEEDGDSRTASKAVDYSHTLSDQVQWNRTASEEPTVSDYEAPSKQPANPGGNVGSPRDYSTYTLSEDPEEYWNAITPPTFEKQETIGAF